VFPSYFWHSTIPFAVQSDLVFPLMCCRHSRNSDRSGVREEAIAILLWSAMTADYSFLLLSPKIGGILFELTIFLLVNLDLSGDRLFGKDSCWLPRSDASVG